MRPPFGYVVMVQLFMSLSLFPPLFLSVSHHSFSLTHSLPLHTSLSLLPLFLSLSPSLSVPLSLPLPLSLSLHHLPPASLSPLCVHPVRGSVAKSPLLSNRQQIALLY